MKTSNSRTSSDNNNTISEQDIKAGEPVSITNKGEEMSRHRDAIYAAELSRLSGEPVYSQSEVDAHMKELFDSAES